MSALILFEDEGHRRLRPLTWTRPVWALRCGLLSLRGAIEQLYEVSASALYPRPALAPLVAEQSGLVVGAPPEGEEPLLLVNGRLLADRFVGVAIPRHGAPRAYRTPEGELVAARLDRDQFSQGWAAVDELESETVAAPLLRWPWELIEHNGPRLQQQAMAYPLGTVTAPPGVYLIAAEAIFIDPAATLQPGVVLDATEGPIVIDRDVTILAQATLQGPCYVGPGSTIKIGAMIYHDTTIGPRCKVGGEVEATILHALSNKQHDGFLGHAYVGQWCNFGAGTSNSDLKNTYGTVAIWSEGEQVDSGSQFVGCFIGDHVRTGINGSINTGSSIGPVSHLFGSGLPPKYLPPFSWGSPAGGWERYELGRALTTAERVMARRQRVPSEAERNLLRTIYEESEGARPRG